MTRKRKTWLIVVVAVVVIAVGITLWFVLGHSVGESNRAAQGSATIAVTRGDIVETLTVYGEVIPKQEYTFTFDADRVEAISVSVGQRVDPDQILVELDSTQQELSLYQAERSLNDARAEGIPAVIREKELSYEMAQRALDNATLRAPFAGVITQITRPTTSTGNWSLTLIDTSELFVEAEVDQLDAPSVAVGQRATAMIEPLPDRLLQVEIVEVGGMAVSRGNSTVVLVTGRLPRADNDILVGYSCEMTITISEALNVLRLPISCLRQTPRGWMVTKVVDGEQIAQDVSVGATSEMYAEITSGLVEGDIVLLNTSASQSAESASTQQQRVFRIQGDNGFPSGFPVAP
jgi:multidrug efflux pump subunit AcrA (membrane-fusion protein)